MKFNYPEGATPLDDISGLKPLCDDVHFWASGGGNLNPFEQAVKIHHRLVFIHPFANGNGRFSRLVADRYLKAFKCKIPRWPIDINKNGVHRKSYIHALKEADCGDYGPLELYISGLIF